MLSVSMSVWRTFSNAWQWADMASFESEERLSKAHTRSVYADIGVQVARAIMYLAIAYAAFTLAARIAA